MQGCGSFRARWTDPSGPAVGHPANGTISLTADGAIKQESDLSDMILSVAEQIAYLSTYFELAPCDVIFSCTPDGVGAVTRGQTMIGAVEGLGEIRLRVV